MPYIISGQGDDGELPRAQTMPWSSHRSTRKTR